MKFVFRLSWLVIPIWILCALPATGQEDRAKLEAEFERMMTGCQLVGFFTDDGQAKDAPHVSLQEDTYTIQKVTKVKDDLWQIHARVQYGERDFTVPFPIRVKWAGDTPVLTLTDFKVPAMGTFTARVLIYRDRYSGLWWADDHGGQMFGKVVRASGGEGEKKQSAQNWPSFHGPGAAGVMDGFATPTEWNVEKGTNIRWKTEIPGLSHSSPVIWGDRVFVLSAEGESEAELKVGLYGNIKPVDDEGEHEFTVYCLDKQSGEILWRKVAIKATPKIKRHTKGSHAASSPATDGRHVVAFFGSEGLYCYDTDGNLLWQKDLGVLDSGFYMIPNAQWGFASSPLIHDDLVLVQCDVQGQSFLAAFDLESGQEVWRTLRDEVPTWGTPTVDVREGRSQVLVNGYKHIGGYDLRTGKELWKLKGGGDIPVPTPVVAHDLIFITNAHGAMAPIFAIDALASGEITMDVGEGSPMVWMNRRRGNYMQTPLVYGDNLVCCSDRGILRVYEARTGEKRFDERLGSGGSGFTASGVAADGKLYFTSEIGEIYVVKASPGFETLAVNDMGETCMATPAISEGTLFFRTRSHLVAVGTE